MKIAINLITSFLFGALIGHLAFKASQGYQVHWLWYAALFVVHFVHYFTKP